MNDPPPKVSTETAPGDSSPRWEQILQDNEPWIRRILANRLSNPDEVDDVFQEVGIAVSRSDLRPDDKEKAGSWLYRVAIRQALQYRRKAGRYRKLMTANREHGVAAVNQPENPLAVILQTERIEAVRNAVAEMKEIDRDILMLKYGENWTYKQMAERLGVSTNTIEHRLVKAKKQLRERLTQKLGEVTI